MAIPYATLSDLATWLPGGVPDNATELLRSATYVVAAAINENPYSVTADQPRKDATTAQVAAWIASGLDPASLPAGTAGGARTAQSIGSASISYSAPTVEQKLAALRELAPDAYNILSTAGLLLGGRSELVPVWNVPIDITTYPNVPSGAGFPSTYPLDTGYGGY